MKGFKDKAGKFRPTEKKNGVRKSRDQSKKTEGIRLQRTGRIRDDLGHGTGLYAEFKDKTDFWNYLQNDRHVLRNFEDNSPNTIPRSRSIVSRVVGKTATKVGFQSIHQTDDPISYLYRSELKKAVIEPDLVDGGSKIIIHEIDEFTDLRRVYRVWNGY